MTVNLGLNELLKTWAYEFEMDFENVYDYYDLVCELNPRRNGNPVDSLDFLRKFLEEKYQRKHAKISEKTEV